MKGYGKLTGPAQNGVFTLEVSDNGKASHIKAKNVILATGSEARMLPGLEANDRVLTNIEILSLKELAEINRDRRRRRRGRRIRFDLPVVRLRSNDRRNAAASRPR